MKTTALISLMIAVITTPTFAIVNNNNKNCDSATLSGATDGSVNLTADWTANTINLEFFPNNGEATIIGQTCTYDGDISLPTPSTKTGYTFMGWRFRPPLDLTTWNYGSVPEFNADYAAWMPITSGTDSVTVARAVATSYEGFGGGTDHSAGLNNGEWTVKFGNGTVKGTSVCSLTVRPDDGNIYVSDVIDESGGGRWCWCRVTGVDTDDNGTYTPVATASWVTPDANWAKVSWCTGKCPYICAKRMILTPSARDIILGVNQ